jgi:hypothetical protein
MIPIWEAKMSTLKTANIQQCLKVIRDYVNADTKLSSKELEEKKAIAQQALEHLGSLFGKSSKDIKIKACGKAVISIYDQISSGCQ